MDAATAEPGFELEEEEEKGGGPGWLATFADLMSLLMCFFVLLLSFSEMDVLKYKQIAGSMKEAFGVQNEVKVKDIPKGTSVIAQEFSAGRPDPTPLNRVQQQSTDTTKMSLDVRSKPPGEEDTTENPAFGADPDDGAGPGVSGGPDAGAGSGNSADPETAETVMRDVLRRQSEETARQLMGALGDEVASGKIEIESGAGSVTIRIRERGSFPSGSATFDAEFLPVMAKLRSTLTAVDGDIAVEGHTDDIPINTAQYRSNWDLSAKRALSVAHELFKDEGIRAERFMVVGFADTRPLAPNDDWKSRARNRRVEIVIRRGIIEERPADIDSLVGQATDLLGALGAVEALDGPLSRREAEVRGP